MASITKQPPILQGEVLYMEQRQDIEIWSLFADLSKTESSSVLVITSKTQVNVFDIWQLWISAKHMGYESLQTC